MLRFAVSFITGIAAFSFFPYFPAAITVLSVFLLLAVCLRGNRPGSAGGWRPLLLLLVAVAGFCYSYIRQEALPEIVFPEEDVTIEGMITGVPEVAEDTFRFTIDDAVVEGMGIPGKVRLVMLPGLFGDNFDKAFFDSGDRISAVGKLREPVPFRNPGVYSKDLKQAGISAVGYLKQVYFSNEGKGLISGIHRKRGELGEIIDNSLSSENASFLKAIIPGLKVGIGRDMRDAFSATGLAHLLSISGTHFGLLAFMAFSLIRALAKCLPVRFFTRMTLYITPTQIAVVVTLPIVVIYAVISGLSTPTVRSFIMVFIYMLALFLGRKEQWLNSLSIAALAILLWQPGALFDLSFLLSFTAVLSIGFVLEKRGELLKQGRLSSPLSVRNCSPARPFSKEAIKGGVQKLHEKLITGLLITCAAVLGTAPLAALYFKQFPLISPVTNLIITPLVCFIILPLGFVSGFSALLFNMSSLPFSAALDEVTYCVLVLMKIFSDIPFSSFHVHSPSIVLIVLYYFSLIVLVKVSGKMKYLPLVLIVSFYLSSPFLQKETLNITFLDAGQGDASVVELPDRKVILIDGSTGEPDMGRRIIAPYLWSKGVKKIDYMVMSHPHPDHYGGLISLMDTFHVRELWFNGRLSGQSEALLEEAVQKRIPLKQVRRGDMLEGEGYRISVLHPYEGFVAGSARGDFSNENSKSLVLKIESDGVSILLTGDIEREAEENLLHLGTWLKSDILKIPHHGGRTSNSVEFINSVNPDAAVASVGRNNAFRHPHKETLERYYSAGARIFRTDMDGAVEVKVKNGQYEVMTYKDSQFIKVSRLRDEVRNLRLLF